MLKIDCLIRKPDDYELLKFDRRRQIKVDHAEISIISPEDLIISKLDWARDSESEMQLRDVKNILVCVNDLDIKYLKSWLQKLGLETLFEKAQSK